MRQHLRVTTNSHGTPTAEVPFNCMWDLVEYLSYQRVSVNYHYESTHFNVCFPRIDGITAQNILNEWASSPANMLQTA